MKHDYFKWIALGVILFGIFAYLFSTRYYVGGSCDKGSLVTKYTAKGSTVLDRWTGKTVCR